MLREIRKSPSGGVRVGPGTRLPRLSALYRPKRKWRLAGQGDLEDYPSWRKNSSSLGALSDKVKDVLDDQSRRGQVLKLIEHEARRQHPDLVMAALGADRKDKPNCKDNASKDPFSQCEQLQGITRNSHTGEK